MLKLDRRTVLRGLGLAGVSIPLPRMEAMAATGAKRLFLLHWPQGVPTGYNGSPGVWFPKEEGAGWTMTECLKPLEPYRNDINIVSGLNYRDIHESSGSHGHCVAIFTGYKVQGPEPEKSRGPSVQHVAAKTLGIGARFSLVSTGIYTQSEAWWSWSAAGVKDPLEVNPQTLFTRLFSNLNVDPQAAAKAALRKKSILDYVKADATDLTKVLGGDDRRRLDDHMAAIRELEKSVAGGVPTAGTCAPPPAPATGSYTLPVAQGNLRYDYSKIVEYTQTMIRLQVMAQRCDLTRVSFISLGGSQNYTVFSHLGIATDYHNICHSGFNDQASIGPRLDDRALAGTYYKKIATYHMEQVAYLMSLLKADDGMGSLLDQSAMIACSEFGDGGLHYDSYIPVVVAGKAGRAGTAAMKTGNNIVVPCHFSQGFQNAPFCANKAGPSRCINDLWQSALVGLGALPPEQKFGDPTLDTRPLEGLWV
jgi:hypothetical protein